MAKKYTSAFEVLSAGAALIAALPKAKGQGGCKTGGKSIDAYMYHI